MVLLLSLATSNSADWESAQETTNSSVSSARTPWYASVSDSPDPASPFSQDAIALFHSLLVVTVPFALFSSYSTPFEFQHIFKLAGPTHLFVTPTLLPLALTSGLSEDRIYILEGNVPGRTSYADLVARARTNSLPRLPIQQAQTDTLAYLAFSSGTSGLPKGTSLPAHLNM